MNRTVAAVSAPTVTAHDGALVHAGRPLQPANREPGAAVAVSVTTPPRATWIRQPEGAATPSVTVQASPSPMPGPPATLPLPVPAPATLSPALCRLNVAVTDRGASRVRTHSPVPWQSPSHPAKTEPDAVVAVRVMLVPPGYLAAQLPVPAPAAMVQAMPSGLAATAPSPSPSPVTVSVTAWSVNPAATMIALSPLATPRARPGQAPGPPAKPEPADAAAGGVDGGPGP